LFDEQTPLPQWIGSKDPPAIAVPEIGVTGAPKIDAAIASTTAGTIADRTFMVSLL
jgi:hypothetical protein